ncbi:MAG: molybdopterin-dependent oxidoreductase [Rhodobacteraceae bacterium]|nr:molybdopterin-dependent oxidoreductase [Paracoccaceae bacterium]
MTNAIPSDQIGFTLNHTSVSANSPPGERLSETLREQMGQRDVKIGCNAGDCGACTVLVDGDPVCACLTPTHRVAGRQVETLTGLVGYDDSAKALSESFLDQGAAQCGICTPGMIVSAVALLRATPDPDEEQVKDAIGGVLCRCTGYRKIIDAVLQAGTSKVTAGADGSGKVGSGKTGSGKVGSGIRHLDGPAKVRGTLAFGDDVAPPGTLVLKVIRSPFARAAFALGDLDLFVATTDGIKATLTAADVPGDNCFGAIPAFVDQPVFAEHETRFRGEAVAAVIGTPEAMRAFDPESFPVDWHQLASVAEVDAAMANDAPQLHTGRDGNEMCKGFVLCGNVDQALEQADIFVEGHFTTGFVEHGYIEPEAGYATFENGKVTVHACTQAPVMDRDALEAILGLHADQIRIVPTAVGGGFGSKLDISVQPFLALGAMKTGHPVRITYTRRETMQSTTKRHPAEMTVKIGAMKDGRLSGLRFDGVFNTGAYASWGPTVATRVPIHASGPYRIADYRAQARAIHTHNPPSGAFRGFGVPQAAIAQEALFDQLAAKLAMDPLEFRILNALDNHQPTVCGQVFEQGVGIRACLKALRPAWAEHNAKIAEFNAQTTGPLRRGVGIAAGWYGCGNTSLANPSTILAGLRVDGTIVLHQGAMDVGQGANTVIAQIFAQAFGVPVAQLTLLGPDTDITPDAGKTSASRQTFVTGNAARLTGEALRARILSMCNASPEATLEVGPGVVKVLDDGHSHQIDLNKLEPNAMGYVLHAEETYDPPTKPLDHNGQGVPYAQFGYAAHLCVVEVDTALGTVKPLHFSAAHDVGQAINPLLVEGQVQGGIAQGLGMALMEEYLPGRTENLHDYLMPTAGDMPRVETIIVEVPDAHGPYGAKGLGEHVLIPTAPAILNAIHNACGARITRLPATPARVHAAIKGLTI